MPAQTPTTVSLVSATTGTSAGIFSATVTSADTVTLSNFTDILNAYVIDLSDNSEATATLATNVVTITQAGLVTQKILIYAQGT
jgi:hypothetical protein